MVKKFQSKVDLLGELYCRSIIIENQYSNISNLFPIQQTTTNNCSKLSSFLSNQSFPINFDSNFVNNSIINESNNLVNKPTNSFQYQSVNNTILPQSYYSLLSNNNTVLIKKTKKQCLSKSHVSYNIMPFLLQNMQKEQFQCKELVTSQKWIKNFLSFDQSHEGVQKSICKNNTNDSIQNLKLSTIPIPLFHATTMQHSTMSKLNNNNVSFSVPFLCSTLSTASSKNSVVGNLDRFSSSTLSCASIDSSFSELSYNSESLGSALSLISNPLLLEKEKKETIIKDFFLSTSKTILSDPAQKIKKKMFFPKRLFVSIEPTINENNFKYFKNNNVKYLEDKNIDIMPPKKKAKILPKDLNQLPYQNLIYNNDVNENFILNSKIKYNKATSNFVKPLISTKQTKKIYSSKASTSTKNLLYKNQKIITDVKSINNITIKFDNIELEKLKKMKPIENNERLLECDCCWTNCKSRFATDNELYDHVILVNF